MKIVVGNLFAIYKREIQSYFLSPFAYVIAGIFWLVAGIVLVTTVADLQNFAAQRDQALAAQGMGGLPPFDAPIELQKSFLGAMGSVILVIMPMLSMGLYAEERRRGTLELLATSPITNWAVALGKLLAAVTFVFGMILPVMVCEAIVLGSSSPVAPAGVFLLGHLGLLLMAAAMLSIGMFISSLTSSTLLAAILSFCIVLLLWIVDAIGKAVGGAIGPVLNQFSILQHYLNLVQGIVDTSGLLMFATYIFLGIFLTALSVETFRFQRSV
jgi:ABC-2 type transport system permease protein